MKIQLILPLILCFLGAIPLYLYSKGDPVIIYRASTSDESLVIDTTGKVIFKINASFSPVLEESDILNRSTYYFFDFTDGPLPVISKDTTYLLNRQGKKIGHFLRKNYTLQHASNGYIIAGYQPEDAKTKKTYLYLDKNGKEAFPDKRFAAAYPFSESHAVVKPLDSIDRWEIINSSGQKVAELPLDMARYIRSASPFSDGLSMISVKPGSYGGKSHQEEHFYIDKEGNIVLNMLNVTGAYNGYAPYPFVNGLAFLRNNPYEFNLFNKQGKVLGRNLSAARIDITDQLLLLALPENDHFVGHVYDHQFKEIPLPSRTNSKVEFIFITDDHIGIYTLDTITKAFASEILKASDLSSVYKTSKIVMEAFDEFVLIGDPRANKLLEIENLKGRQLFGATPETRVFESFKEALPHKEKVNHLKIAYEKSVDALCGFSSLRTLELYKFAGQKLPVCIGYIPNLSEFDILQSPSLSELPKSLAKAGHLTKLTISDCPKIENLESIIESCKQLKVVTLINMEISQEFLDRMKKDRPELTINTWRVTSGN